MSKCIKAFIKEVLITEKKKRKKPGGGVVVVRNFDGEWKVLALKIKGQYDIPKGIIDPGEDALSAAMRETVEEASISSLDFEWDLESYQASAVTVFLASTNQDPAIVENPKTGIREHDSAAWVTWEDMLGGVYGYLSPAISWAKEKVESSQ